MPRLGAGVYLSRKDGGRGERLSDDPESIVSYASYRPCVHPDKEVAYAIIAAGSLANGSLQFLAKIEVSSGERLTVSTIQVVLNRYTGAKLGDGTAAPRSVCPCLSGSNAPTRSFY